MFVIKLLAPVVILVSLLCIDLINPSRPLIQRRLPEIFSKTRIGFPSLLYRQDNNRSDRIYVKCH